jgi:hypothetical protein
VAATEVAEPDRAAAEEQPSRLGEGPVGWVDDDLVEVVGLVR